MGFAPAVGCDGCSGGPAPGTVDLANSLLHRWGPLGAYSLGIYNCRKIAGSTAWSVHASGRAFDLGVPADSRPELGDAALRELLASSTHLLQRIIWWRTVYDATSPAGRPYSGVDPHESHLHIESSVASARGLSNQEIAAILGESEPKRDESVTLIVAYNNAQWAVAGDLSTRVGLASSDDVRTLLALDGGALFRPAVLSTSLMARIPEVRSL